MDKRYKFNEDVKNYDNWRPKYCIELFNDILSYSNLDSNKYAVEIGIGTGQATEPFLKTGCTLTAVELGTELAEFSRKKFEIYPKFDVVNVAFEDFEYLPESIDLIYSATAFHWIPESEGYLKVFKMLRSGGTLALFWNHPFVDKPDSELHQEISKLYLKHLPSLYKPIAENDTERYNKIQNTITSYGFRPLNFKLYHGIRNFTSEGYINLLNTYSDHRSAPANEKEHFENKLADLIKVYGDSINIYDTIDLYLAKKP